MKGQGHLVFKMDMELEFGEVDSYGVVDIFSHYFIPSNLIEKTGDFPKSGKNEKKSDGTYGQILYQRSR